MISTNSRWSRKSRKSKWRSMVTAKNWINLAGEIVVAEISWEGGKTTLFLASFMDSVNDGKEKGIVTRQDFSKPDGDEAMAKLIISQLKADMHLEEHEDPEKFEKFSADLEHR